MKRVPIILAGFVTTFLTICFLEYGFRGLNPEVESDWVLHPAWWQSNLLADGGFYLWAYAATVFTPFERLFGDNSRAVYIFVFSAAPLIILAASLFVFYCAKLLICLPSFVKRFGKLRWAPR